ncbi:uncharacterized protein [Macrobrachium rosenbergii]|uniref:uncharacterized protein n=1 Tax=Macrobrachium rosenbergii TaxID=79674 RepID=UPI0034D73263
MKKSLKVVLELFVLVTSASSKVRGDSDVSHVSQNMGEDGYVFEYSVVDGDSSWVQSHGEWSDGVSTHGSYNVKLPDGRIQKVIYTADEHGFRPVISYESPLRGYGWRHHIGLGDTDDYGSSHEDSAGGNIFRYEENAFEADELYDPLPPPFYGMAKSHNVPAHKAPKGYEMHESSENSEEVKSTGKEYSFSYAPPAHKRVGYPSYHTVNKYRQGPAGNPKYNYKKAKDFGGKYPVEKAKTYYVNNSGKEVYMTGSSEEKDMKDTKDMKHANRDDYKRGKDMEDNNTAMEVMDDENESTEMAPFTPRPKTSYQVLSGDSKKMKKMMGKSHTESSEEEKEYADKEMKGKEERSEEKSTGYASEESEEEESEEKSQYVAKMTSMMPPDKPYVPPTYFSIPSSGSSSEESSIESSSYLSPTTPMPSPEDKPSPPSGKGFDASPGADPHSSYYPTKSLNPATANVIPPSNYPLFESPYSYHPPHHHSYHHHHHPHLHHMTPYSFTPMTPVYHHPYSQHHYPPPSRYSYPYMMGDAMHYSPPSALYVAPPAEVSEAE